MVCYQDANGNATAQRNARGKHYVVFDQPADQGQRLKTAYELTARAAARRRISADFGGFRRILGGFMLSTLSHREK